MRLSSRRRRKIRLNSRAVQGSHAAAEPRRRRRRRRRRPSHPRKPERVVHGLDRVVHEDLGSLGNKLRGYKNNIESDVHEGSVALNS